MYTKRHSTGAFFLKILPFNCSPIELSFKWKWADSTSKRFMELSWPILVLNFFWNCTNHKRRTDGWTADRRQLRADACSFCEAFIRQLYCAHRNFICAFLCLFYYADCYTHTYAERWYFFLEKCMLWEQPCPRFLMRERVAWFLMWHRHDTTLALFFQIAVQIKKLW